MLMNDSSISWFISNYTEEVEDIRIHALNPVDSVTGGTLIRKEGYSPLFEFIVVGIGITVVTVIGIIGNIISACVLSRNAMRSPMNCLLLGLTLSDSIVIFCALFIFGLPAICTYIESLQENYYMNTMYRSWGPSLYAMAVTGQTSSIYFTIAVTVERYLGVCCPLKARSLCTLKRTKIAAVLIFFFSILYNIPRWWELAPKDVIQAEKNASYTSTESDEYGPFELDFTSFRLRPLYVQLYVNWGYLIIMCLFPFVILITLNIIIYITIRRSNANRHGIITGPTRDHSFALILFSVTATFLACNTLAIVMNLMEVIWGILNIRLENTSNLLITLNSSVNCGIYCACGKNFRDQLFQMRDDIGSSFRSLCSNVSEKLPGSTGSKQPSQC